MRDGGTYSYADTTGAANELASVAGHNTVQFNGRDQMPRLSRFLYGAWLQVRGDEKITQADDSQIWAGEYVIIKVVDISVL